MARRHDPRPARRDRQTRPQPPLPHRRTDPHCMKPPGSETSKRSNSSLNAKPKPTSAEPPEPAPDPPCRRCPRCRHTHNLPVGDRMTIPAITILTTGTPSCSDRDEMRCLSCGMEWTATSAGSSASQHVSRPSLPLERRSRPLERPPHALRQPSLRPTSLPDMRIKHGLLPIRQRSRMPVHHAR